MKKVFAAVLTTGLLLVAVVSAGSLNSLLLPPTVSGNVTYGNPHPSSIRPVADVDLTATGDPMVEGRTGPDRTPTWGQYSLTGFGETAYSITPNKGGSLNNFINSFDAAKI